MRQDGDNAMQGQFIRLQCSKGDYGAKWSGLQLPEAEDGLVFLAHNYHNGQSRFYGHVNGGWEYVSLKEA